MLASSSTDGNQLSALEPKACLFYSGHNMKPLDVSLGIDYRPAEQASPRATLAARPARHSVSVALTVRGFKSLRESEALKGSRAVRDCWQDSPTVAWCCTFAAANSPTEWPTISSLAAGKASQIAQYQVTGFGRCASVIIRLFGRLQGFESPLTIPIMIIHFSLVSRSR